MKTSFFALLGLAFPNSDIRFTTLGAELYDKQGKPMGYVPNTECFYLWQEYEHFDAAKRALEERGVRHEVTDKGRVLYSRAENG